MDDPRFEALMQDPQMQRLMQNPQLQRQLQQNQQLQQMHQLQQRRLPGVDDDASSDTATSASPPSTYRASTTAKSLRPFTPDAPR
jgi:hypothetical protein